MRQARHMASAACAVSRWTTVLGRCRRWNHRRSERSSTCNFRHVDVMKVMMQNHSRRMRRLTAAGLLPERAGQPVKAWVHISLADLLRLDGDSALQQEWTEQVRARWAARRAHAAETGANDGAWLDGDAAAAIACDAAMAPIVTGDVNVDALEDLVRLCVELDRLRQGGGSPGTPAPGTTAARAALEQAVIGKTIIFLLHSTCSPELERCCLMPSSVPRAERSRALVVGPWYPSPRFVCRSAARQSITYTSVRCLCRLTPHQQATLPPVSVSVAGDEA